MYCFRGRKISLRGHHIQCFPNIRKTFSVCGGLKTIHTKLLSGNFQKSAILIRNFVLNPPRAERKRKNAIFFGNLVHWAENMSCRYMAESWSTGRKILLPGRNRNPLEKNMRFLTSFCLRWEFTYPVTRLNKTILGVYLKYWRKPEGFMEGVKTHVFTTPTNPNPVFVRFYAKRQWWIEKKQSTLVKKPSICEKKKILF